MNAVAIGDRVFRPKGPRSAYYLAESFLLAPPIGTVIPFKDGATTWEHEGVTYALVRWDKTLENGSRAVIREQPVPMSVLLRAGGL